MKHFSVVPVLLFLYFVIVGCSSQNTEEHTTNSAAEDSAEAAVRKIADGIDNGQAIVAWEALPAAYQNDVNGVVRDFASAMDPAVWTQTTALLTSVQKLLEDKQEFIVNHPAVTSGPDPEAAKTALPLLAGILNSILATGSDLESLKTFDGAEFTKTNGSEFLKQYQGLAALAPAGANGRSSGLLQLKDVQIETLESSDTTATLKMALPDGTAEERRFVKSDGKWLPEEMVRDWDVNISKVKGGIATMPEQLMSMKGQIAMVLGAAGGMLAPLQAATDQDQFNAAVNNLQGGVMGMMMMSGMGGQPPGLSVTPQTATPSAAESSGIQGAQNSIPVEEKSDSPK